MLDLTYDYLSCVRSSEKIAWKLDEVMPEGTHLDFSRPFLPQSLAGKQRLAFLSDVESRTLNQISGHAYLNLFQFVEEFILATMVQHAEAEMFGDRSAIRALLRFADEEAKHQELFFRYMAAFARDAGYEAEVLGAASEVAGVVMGKSPIAVMMVTLHIELMTMAHYVESVRDDRGIDPFFAKLLHVHWLEESQHARIDALELDKLLDQASPELIEKAFADYLDLIAAFDGLLESQAVMDVASLARALGRELDAAESAAIVRSQHGGYRRTFLVAGMTNATFAEHLRAMWSEGADRVREKAAELS